MAKLLLCFGGPLNGQVKTAHKNIMQVPLSDQHPDLLLTYERYKMSDGGEALVLQNRIDIFTMEYHCNEWLRVACRLAAQ